MNSGVGTWEEAELKAQQAQGSKKKGSQGGFQTMGLMPPLMTAVKRMGFTVPTPIQRRAIPMLILGHDVVAMARTGSGKTAAFLIPLLHRLRCEHSTIVGMRAIILSPTRELALQTLRVAKKLAGLSAAAVSKARLGLEDSASQGTPMSASRAPTAGGGNNQPQPYKGGLRCIAVVGGTSLDAQFTEMATNPDIVIASPGRLLHLLEEASIKLSQVECVIMDEADRLFELGLQPQIIQLLQRVPEGTVQRCLFSATMPSVLAEFANAGLHNPLTIRLDSEMKISDKLKHFSFFVRGDEKLAGLIFLLKHVIKIRLMTFEEQLAASKNTYRRNKGRKRRQDDEEDDNDQRQKGKYAKGKRPRDEEKSEDDEEEEEEAEDEDDVNPDGTYRTKFDCGPQALVFVESKHHVDLFERIMEACAISCSAIHGQMDQEARRLGVQRFARKKVSVMIVTDVAARGLDIPLLDHVINYNFPHNPKLFIHRVGRVARAGRAGCAYSFFTAEELPYYIDLMRFLDKPLQCVKTDQTYDKVDDSSTAATEVKTDIYGFREDEDGYFGRMPPQDIQVELNFLSKIRLADIEIAKMFKVADNAHIKYEKTKKKASREALRETYDRRQNHLRKAHSDDEDDGSDEGGADRDNLRLTPARYTDGSDYYHTPIHPLLIRTRMTKLQIEAEAAKLKLRGYKSGKEGGGVLDFLAGEVLFKVPERRTLADEERERKENVQPSNDSKETRKTAKASSAPPAVEAPKPALSLAERMLQRAKERREGAAKADQGFDTAADAAEQAATGLSVAFGIFTSAKGGAASFEAAAAKRLATEADIGAFTRYRDKDFYMIDSKKDTIENQHYTVEDATIDLLGETAKEAQQQRSVYAWNKKKSRYQKMNINDAKALLRGMKNEAGKQIDFKGKLEMYSKWMKKSNMRIQDTGEEEDAGSVARATALARTGTFISDDKDDDNNYGPNADTENLLGERPNASNSIKPLARKRQFNKQDVKDRDAFGNLRAKGIVGISKRQERRNRAEAFKPRAAESTGNDEDYVDIRDPNQGKRVIIGRKQKKLPKLGEVRDFDALVARKKAKEEQRRKEGKGRKSTSTASNKKKKVVMVKGKRKR